MLLSFFLSSLAYLAREDLLFSFFLKSPMLVFASSLNTMLINCLLFLCLLQSYAFPKSRRLETLRFGKSMGRVGMRSSYDGRHLAVSAMIGLVYPKGPCVKGFIPQAYGSVVRW